MAPEATRSAAMNCESGWRTLTTRTSAVIRCSTSRQLRPAPTRSRLGMIPTCLNRSQRVARIIAVANQKGGVGKTTTAINLAAALAMHNQRTLLIDMDPQANSTLTFINPADVDGSIFDVLTGDKRKMQEVVKPTRWMNLSLVPSRISLAKLEAQLVGQFDAPFRLKDAIALCRDDFDMIVIDTPPALGIITVNALVA